MGRALHTLIFGGVWAFLCGYSTPVTSGCYPCDSATVSSRCLDGLNRPAHGHRDVSTVPMVCLWSHTQFNRSPCTLDRGDLNPMFGGIQVSREKLPCVRVGALHSRRSMLTAPPHGLALYPPVPMTVTMEKSTPALTRVYPTLSMIITGRSLLPVMAGRRSTRPSARGGVLPCTHIIPHSFPKEKPRFLG